MRCQAVWGQGRMEDKLDSRTCSLTMLGCRLLLSGNLCQEQACHLQASLRETSAHACTQVGMQPCLQLRMHEQNLAAVARRASAQV